MLEEEGNYLKQVNVYRQKVAEGTGTNTGRTDSQLQNIEDGSDKGARTRNKEEKTGP